MCHEASPYWPGEKWGLQEALIYACQMFIDKSMTTNINQQIFKNVIDNDIEFISEDSDDEETVNQCIEITINNDMLYKEISNDDNDANPALPPNDNDLNVNNHDMVDDVSDYEQQQQCLTKKRQLHSGTRSAEARKRRNRKRNLYFRMRRYKYLITCPSYCQFTMKLVRRILAEYNIHYSHVKSVEDLLIIGVKNKIIKQQNERRLPGDIFDKHHYYLFRCQARHLSRKSNNVQE
ncbi:unnamed protein product [Rotaria sp. Silwood2]|nr:unnamed protein product [Rotaria sp. Silwood2]CAF3140835.1 unnamed protein product [Rotaria sp. Silwood2]CAF4460746.1 unnamed protein product [Rotaria sp. Silwood2]CAF4497915.1 unnamed protein product [Rotaria sp. Silwood2]